MSSIFDRLDLRHGPPLPNRIAKAAMEEHLAGKGQVPDERILRLYRAWGQGGLGLILTGNVMVDARALTSPGGIVLDARSPLAPFQRWAEAAQAGGARVWMQINHPGRQVNADMPGVKIGPSAVPLDLGAQSKRFRTPTAMTETQIQEVINAFITAATRSAEAGFDGVQVHAAHGYLLSQFLSPISNKRTDSWGGSIENRARLLFEIVSGIRARVDDGFSVGVKINSADFQRGGFDVEDATWVVKGLNERSVDLVEVSGGTYESPAMQGVTADERTLAREAYFLLFAEQIRTVATMPLMLTGGITRRETAQRVVDVGIDVVGMGTALAMEPDLANRWRGGDDAPGPSTRAVMWKDKALASAARLAIVRQQLRLVGEGRAPRPQVLPLFALLDEQVRRHFHLHRYRTWLESRDA